MAVEAADGMTYLAGQRLVHRDLAARNCMLDHNLTLKIGDFGLSRNLQLKNYRTGECEPAVVVPAEGHGVLPIKWMAPESLQLGVYSSQSDVWSYGVLLWEMVTRGATPYKNNTNEEVVRLVVEQRATLGRPSHCPLPLGKVMRRTWSYDPSHRPTFRAITTFLLKHVSQEFEELFRPVSFFHSLRTDPARCVTVREAGSQYLTSSSDEDHHQQFANTDVNHESTPECEATNSSDVTSRKKCILLCHDHFSSQPISASHSTSKHPHSASYADQMNTDVTENYFFDPSDRCLTQRHAATVPHVYTNCLSFDLPHAPAPHTLTSCQLSGEVITADEEGLAGFPEALEKVATSPNDTSFSGCIGTITVSGGRLTTPPQFPGANIGESFALSHHHTTFVPSKPVSAPATPSSAPFHALLPMNFAPEGQGPLTRDMDYCHDLFTVTGIPSNLDAISLGRTEGSASPTASASFSYKSLPELHAFAHSSNTLPPTTVSPPLMPTSLGTPASAAIRASPSSSSPSKLSVFSATSYLSCGCRHCHAPLETKEDVELM